jgi:uncharacterized protein with ParB-like and HNH nuclease domain
MSAMKIHGSEYVLSKVFSDDFSFDIPHYQRPYLWTLEETGELWDDLTGAVDSGNGLPIDEVPPYFLGAIVLIKQDHSADAKVVDGQQRLTTLTILLSALREAMVDEDRKAGLTEFLYDEGNPILGTTNRYRLQVRDRDRKFFKEHVQEPGGLQHLAKIDEARLESISQKSLRANALFLLERAMDLPEEARQRLATFLLTRCVLVVVTSPDLDSAYRVFAVLNNRGLDLSHTDILKAEVVGQLPPAVSEEYSEKWEEAENALGVDPFKALFAHIRMIYVKQKMGASLLKEFRKHVLSKHNAKELIDDVILPYSDAYEDITTASFESASQADKINGLLRWLGQIDNFDWIPPAITFLKEHRDEAQELVRFLTDLERLAAAMMITRVVITKRIQWYGRLLTAMEKGEDLYAEQSPLQLTAEERAKVTTALDGDIYTIKNVPRYVLLRLDALLSGGEAHYNLPVISIEHVLPQTPSGSSEWLVNFPDETKRASLVHRLGNLVLLSGRKNAAASNCDFDEKKAKYFRGKGGVSHFALTTQVLSESAWTPDVIERRQRELLSKLVELWRL